MEEVGGEVDVARVAMAEAAIYPEVAEEADVLVSVEVAWACTVRHWSVRNGDGAVGPDGRSR